MKVTRTAIPEVMLIEPRVFGDARGFFYESFNERAFAEATGVQTAFVQDNLPIYQPTNLPIYQPTNLPTYQPTNPPTRREYHAQRQTQHPHHLGR